MRPGGWGGWGGDAQTAFGFSSASFQNPLPALQFSPRSVHGVCPRPPPPGCLEWQMHRMTPDFKGAPSKRVPLPQLSPSSLGSRGSEKKCPLPQRHTLLSQDAGGHPGSLLGVSVTDFQALSPLPEPRRWDWIPCCRKVLNLCTVSVFLPLSLRSPVALKNQD